MPVVPPVAPSRTPRDLPSAPAGTSGHAETGASRPLLVAASAAPVLERPLSRRRLLARLFVLAAVVAIAVTFAAGTVARGFASREEIDSAATRAQGVAVDLVQPMLTDPALASGATAARIGSRIRGSVSGHDIVHYRIWSASGTVLYSDEPRLIGERFALASDARGALHSSRTVAKASNLSEVEDRFERGSGPLLEIYHGVHTPEGTPLLFEAYYRYGDMRASTDEHWLSFASLVGASLLLLLVALLPLLNGLVRRVERAKEERELSLLTALDASDAERRRIAGAVHDGPVQDLVGASYRLGATAASVRGTELEPLVEAAEEAVRGSIEALRDMLVDLYPAALSEEGIARALGDLAGAARARGAVVLLRIEDDVAMPAEAQRLMYRVARETIANAVKHGGSTPVRVEIRRNGAATVLTVRDDGPGFDGEATIQNPPAGHFGMRLLQDAVRQSGVDATLTLATAPGAGTVWRLSVA